MKTTRAKTFHFIPLTSAELAQRIRRAIIRLPRLSEPVVKVKVDELVWVGDVVPDVVTSILDRAEVVHRI